MSTVVARPPAVAEAARKPHIGMPRWVLVLNIIALALLGAGVWMSLAYAGLDATQGAVQRIFYTHMASFFGAFVAFATTVVAGVVYLRRRTLLWDAIGLAGVEVGLVLALVNLATGSVWARPIWNTWWTWDPRLTSAAIMALTYAAYLMLRAGVDEPDQRRRFAAVYGIFAFSTVIVTLLIIRVREDTIHPVVVAPELATVQAAEAQGGFAMEDAMRNTLLLHLGVWGLLLPIAMMSARVMLERAAQRVEAVRARVLGGPSEVN